MHDQYKISITGEASEEQLVRGIHLIMMNVSRVPHIALAVDGKVFSLSVKGASADGDLHSLLRTIELRSIESIFVQLDAAGGIGLSAQARACFLRYNRVEEGAVTCLAPVKDICRNVFGIDVDHVSFIYELLPLLENEKLVRGHYHSNLGEKLEDHVFSLQRYTMDDIDNEIRKAEREIRNEELKIKN